MMKNKRIKKKEFYQEDLKADLNSCFCIYDRFYNYTRRVFSKDCFKLSKAT
jgi:hypothetical protein